MISLCRNIYHRLPKGLQVIISRIYHKARQRAFRQYKISVCMPSNICFELMIPDRVAEAWYALKDDIQPSVRRMLYLAEPRDHVIEVGSHQGYTTLALATAVGPTGIVYAFEPYPYNFRFLQKNLRNNCTENVIPYQKVVGAEHSSVYFSTSTVVNKAESAKAGKSIEVEQVCLDDICDGVRVDLLKIDVEGYECEVLKGARKILAQRPKLMIEIHVDYLSRYGYSPQDVIHFLDLDGYLFFVQQGEEEDMWSVKDFSSFDFNSDKFQLYAVPSERPCPPSLVREGVEMFS